MSFGLIKNSTWKDSQARRMHRSFIRITLRKTLIFMVVCAICLVQVTVADARPHRLQATSNSRYAAIIMDAQTGRVINETNPDKKLYPASITKLMTIFLAFESVQRGRLYMDKYLTISTNATRQPPTKLGVRPGDHLTVKQAVLALITRSANDVAVVLAENIGGSEDGFARMMNARARSLGMNNTHFVNPNGLPNGAQTTTVRDIAILSRALMQYFPNQYPLFSTASFVYKREVITNHNHLMESFEGMDGLKTGFTNASGFNLAASAVRNNRRLIVIVFGGKSAASRDAHVAELFNKGFAMLSRGEQKTQMAGNTPRVSTPGYTPPQAIQPVQMDDQDDTIANPVANPETVTAEATTVETATDTTPDTTFQAAVASTTSQPATEPAAVVAHAAPPSQPPAATKTSRITPSRPAIEPVKTSRTTKAATGWVPDGGQPRTLQLPNSYQPPVSAIQPVQARTATRTTPSNMQAGVLPSSQPAQYKPSTEASSGWGIQVGAYTDVAAGQQALALAQQQLGGLPAAAKGVIVPSTTPAGTIYRARILGLSSQAANQACARLNDCMIFAVR